MADLIKAYQLPTPNEWEIQALDVLITLGMDTLNKALTSGLVIVVDPSLLKEYVEIIRCSNDKHADFLKKISDLSDQARRDTGRM